MKEENATPWLSPREENPGLDSFDLRIWMSKERTYQEKGPWDEWVLNWEFNSGSGFTRSLAKGEELVIRWHENGEKINIITRHK